MVRVKQFFNIFDLSIESTYKSFVSFESHIESIYAYFYSNAYSMHDPRGGNISLYHIYWSACGSTTVVLIKYFNNFWIDWFIDNES